MSEGSSIDRIDQFSKAGPFDPRVILGRLIAKNESVVLDIGTGSGLWALESARLGAKGVLAVDRSPERVSYVARQASNLGLPNVRAIPGTAERLPVDSASIDVVIAGLVLHEVNDLSAAMAEVKRVLKDGGTLVIIELLPSGNPHHPRIDIQFLRGHLVDEGFELSKFDEQDGWYCLVATKGVPK